MVYFILDQNNNIIAKLDQQPQTLPAGLTWVSYNGFVPVHYLEHRNGTITPTQNVPQQDIALEEAKRQAIKEIMMQAARLFQQIRARYYFNLTGYEEVFKEKVDEAIDCLAASNEDASKFPLLKSESDVLGISVIDVAKTILQRRARFIQQTAQIDQLMNQVQFDIEASTTLALLTKVREDGLVKFTVLEIELNRV